MLEAGQTAPPFELPDEQSRSVSFQDFQGHPLVLFFFPKANTPG